MPIAVSVNLSARNLRDARLPSFVAGLLGQHGLRPRRLLLEITESALMFDPDQALSTVRALRSLGLGVAVDDYGTGYSSLAYLRQLPLHELKIDRSFVRDVTVEPGDLSIVRSTITLAHELGLRVVAEGVEDAATLEPAGRPGLRHGPGLPPQPARPAGRVHGLGRRPSPGRRCARAPPRRPEARLAASAAPPRLRGGRSADLPYSSVRHAEDEDPFGRQEALQADRQGQGPGASRLHEPHPREEVAEAEARARPPRDAVRSGREDRQEAAGGQDQ